MILTFWIVAILLGLVSIAFVLVPLMWPSRQMDTSRTDTNVMLYEEKLAEIAADESLDEQQRDILVMELKKSLLEDSDEDRGHRPAGQAGKLGSIGSEIPNIEAVVKEKLSTVF